jgi:hypothetical protein
LSTSRPEPAAAAPTPEGDARLQRALADAVSAFGARAREHGELLPFPGDREVSATEVAFTVAAMLRAAEVSSFEIAAMFNI